MIKLAKDKKCVVIEKSDKNKNICETAKKETNRNKYKLIIRETTDGYKNIRFVEDN